MGDHGYYEAIDYSRQSEPGGAAGIVVHCFMVHHQGMSLLAFDNALQMESCGRVSTADPRIRATEPLLHEHIPAAILPTTGQVHEERPLPRVDSLAGRSGRHAAHRRHLDAADATALQRQLLRSW